MIEVAPPRLTQTFVGQVALARQALFIDRRGTTYDSVCRLVSTSLYWNYLYSDRTLESVRFQAQYRGGRWEALGYATARLVSNLEQTFERYVDGAFLFDRPLITLHPGVASSELTQALNSRRRNRGREQQERVSHQDWSGDA